MVSAICSYDDTNPVKEDVEYVDSIEEDVKMAADFQWDNRLWASDYFDEMYDCAAGLSSRRAKLTSAT